MHVCSSFAYISYTCVQNSHSNSKLHCLLHLYPDSTLRVCSHMRCDPNLFDGFPPISCRPRGRRFCLRIRIHIQSNRLECLHNSSNDDRCLVIRELLSKADPWSSIERQEYERIRNEIFLNPIIQESVRIELVRCRMARQSVYTRHKVN